ncbi:hypothetical protein DFJ73DRAFT_849743 [Zopfochytrium polystomum]|nr:hypothetical protein DFJ73DRAFT_849743 [Zopfochytrium polystomum]
MASTSLSSSSSPSGQHHHRHGQTPTTPSSSSSGAFGSGNSSNTPICKFYQSGSCRAGTACKFSHNLAGAPPTLSASVCQFYIMGTCRYGSKCVYLHQKPKPATPPASLKSTTVRPKPPSWLPPPPTASPLAPTSSLSSSPSVSSSPIAVKSAAAAAAATAIPSPPTYLPIAFPAAHDHDDFDAFDPTLPPIVDDFLIYSASASAGGGSPDPGLLEPQHMSYSDMAKRNGELGGAVAGGGVLAAGPNDKMGRSAQPRTILCPFAMHGICKFGDMCRYTHGAKCPKCMKFCLDPFMTTEEQEAEHVAGCTGTMAVPAPASGAGSSDMDCVVCFERVMGKKDPRFGLLNCEHCVCLDCIRQWRQNDRMDNSKSCPICRQTTYIVVPSTVWIVDADEKQAALDAYKKRMGSIDCKHYAFGEGSCPFGTSCLYRHVLRDGTVEEVRLRIVQGDDDQTRVVNLVQLSDFL